MPANTDENKQSGQHLIGWAGITAQVPEEWALASISADEKEGYLRVDDRDMPRLEIKWVESSGFVDLDQTVDKYLKSVHKSMKKEHKGEDIEFRVDRDTRVVSKRQMQKDGLVTFAWTAQHQAYGAVWLCKECERTVIAQVVGRGDDENLLATAQQVITSIQDHPRDGWMTWAAYGFVCQLPEDFVLSSQQMYSALIKFSFSRGNETIEVGRWGMAETLLRNQTIDEWLQQELGRELGQYKPRSEETQIRGHQAVSFAGTRMPLMQGLKRFVSHLLGRPYPDKLLGHAWHCEKENRIFVVHALLDSDNYELADQVRDRIKCH